MHNLPKKTFEFYERYYDYDEDRWAILKTMRTRYLIKDKKVIMKDEIKLTVQINH